jgi:hypothetical protein
VSHAAPVAGVDDAHSCHSFSGAVCLNKLVLQFNLFLATVALRLRFMLYVPGFGLQVFFML